MTGYGEAHYQSESLSLSIELRALNNRYLKVTVRAPEPYNLLEPEFEKVIRRTIRRGTIQLNLHYERQHAAGDFRINATALKSYMGQLRAMEGDIDIDRSDLIKEVSIFAERSDIAEETVRLGSHLDQFQEFMKDAESPGRKLEFLTQEMFRETNTIGSKASDVEISRHVVEIKGTLEKIRELVQNIE